MMYMLDFKGIGPEIAPGQLESAIEGLKDGGNLQDALAQRGALPATIEAWAISRELVVTDRGLGGDRWHIGIPFDEAVLALHFMLDAEKVFAEALKHRWICLHLMTWSRGEDKPTNKQGGAQP